MVRRAWHGLSSGLIAGTLAGLCEAIYVLAGVSTGEYLALLYAALLYSLVGAALGLGVGLVLGVLERLRPQPDPVAWALGFSAAFWGMVWLIARGAIERAVYQERSLDAAGEAVLAVGVLGAMAFGVWLVSILMQRTPLKILLTPRGTAALYGTLLVLSAVFSVAPTPPAPAVEKHQPPDLAEHPNVLLIVADALRADRLGAYGHAGQLTPSLDRLAEEGLIFERAYATAPWTRPAMGALLTSLPPSAHGAERRSASLRGDVVTLAELLSERTYITLGLPNHIDVTRSFNFQQGFDVFRYMAPSRWAGLTESAQRLALLGLLRRARERLGVTRRVEDFYRPADAMVDEAEALIAAQGEQRWFLWLHLMDTHAPYFSHPDPGPSAAPSGHAPTAADRAQVMALYDGEVRHLDAAVGRLLDWLRETGRLEDTLVVFTADHGEELQDHGGWWHGDTLYDEVLRVPLIVRLPGQVLAGGRIPWQVRHIDVAPTIARAVGADPAPAWLGLDLLEPEAAAWASGEAARRLPDRVAFAESITGGIAAASVRVQGWKYIRAAPDHPRHPRPDELYWVQSDPAERINLAGREGAMQARMSGWLRQARAEAAAAAGLPLQPVGAPP